MGPIKGIQINRQKEKRKKEVQIHNQIVPADFLIVYSDDLEVTKLIMGTFFNFIKNMFKAYVKRRHLFLVLFIFISGP